MAKSRMFGAGLACSTLYKTNVNQPTGGGTKKQGFGSRIGANNWAYRQTRRFSNGIGRFKLVFMNQLSGVGPGHSMFPSRFGKPDGVHKV